MIGMEDVYPDCFKQWTSSDNQGQGNETNDIIQSANAPNTHTINQTAFKNFSFGAKLRA